MANIAGMQEDPQQAILNLAHSGTWDFNKTPSAPMDGTVLLWLETPTHSAIVSNTNAISGYNQINQWPDLGIDYSTRSPVDIIVKFKITRTISEDTIVLEAGKREL